MTSPHLDLALKAIAEPRRRQILALLRGGNEFTAGDVAAHFPDVTRTGVSQHLQIIAEAGLVTVRREGTKRLYSFQPQGLSDLRAFLDTFWAHNLDQLKTAAEAEQRDRDAKGDRSP